MHGCTKGAIDHFSSIWWLQIQHAPFEQTTAEKSAVSNSRACLIFFLAPSYIEEAYLLELQSFKLVRLCTTKLQISKQRDIKRYIIIFNRKES